MYYKYKILSEDDKFPFADSIISFFKKYKVNKTVGSYFFYPSTGTEYPLEEKTTTSVLELKKIKYNTDIVFWSFADSLIDQKGFYDFHNYYSDKKISNTFLLMLEICKKYPKIKFIFFPSFYDLTSWKKKEIPNFFICKNVINIDFDKKNKERYERCNKKTFQKEKGWVCLSNYARPHRIALYSFLIKNNLQEKGMISNNKEKMKFTISNLSNDYFNNEAKKITKKHFPYVYKHFIEGLEKIKKEKDFIWIDNYLELEKKEAQLENNINLLNYKKNLFKIYKNTAIEIIPSTLFFETTPLLGEKEIQSIYGMNIPIYISAYKTVSFIRNEWGIDVFDDIVDHSYDEIKDPGERLVTALESNKKLLLMTAREHKLLWEKVKYRLERNCDILDYILYNPDYRRENDFKEIKKALNYFKIDFEKR